MKTGIGVVVAMCSGLALVAAEIPRAEYPQPQFERDQWMTLNGPWEFAFDDGNRGIEENWAGGSKKFGRNITVPFCFESAMSGIGDTSFHPWVWYRRTITKPDAWKGRRVLLHFGAVDYRAMVWVNGRLAGEHQGGNTPFQMDITPLLKTAGNSLIVRAEDPPTDRFIPRGKQYWEPKSHGIFYTRTTGIWQSVWLEAAGESYLDRVRITPSNDGSVRFEARVSRPGQGLDAGPLEFHATVLREKKAIASAMATADGPRATAMVAIPDPKLWAQGDPQLYNVTFELRHGSAVLDRVHSYFGFRAVTVDGNRVLLNGRPTILKFILDQGYWPQSTLTPPSDDAIQYDIRRTKEMGFNGVRKHQKLEDPRYLYWADHMGLLVSSEMANAYLFDNDYAEAFTREWTGAVERDYNHPSIVIWVPINESWGVPHLSEARQQQHLRSLYTLTHSLDTTRLVIDNDGWEHTNLTDLFAIHDYARTGEMLYGKYKDLGAGLVPDNARAALAPGNVYNGSPVYLSEFGGIAFIAPGSNVPGDAWGYSGVEKTAGSALERLRGLYTAMAKIPALAGFCYTQLTDVEQEINGLMTYDRQPKYDVRVVKEINELVH